MYGFVEEKATENQGGGNLHFGLNTGCLVKEMSFDVEKENLLIIFDFNGQDVKYWINKPVAKSGGSIIDATHPDYEKQLDAAKADVGAVCTSIFKCFVREEALKEALNGSITTFEMYIKKQLALLNPAETKKVPLDIFMCYDYNINSEGKKYLRIPTTRKHGAFICRKAVGEYKEKMEGKTLTYVNAEGNIHPFVRTEWFMTSEYAKKTGVSNILSSTPQDGNATDFPILEPTGW